MPLPTTDWTPIPLGRVRALNGALGVEDERGRPVYERARHRAAVAEYLRATGTVCERCAHYGLRRQAVRVVVTDRHERVALCGEHARRAERDCVVAVLPVDPEHCDGCDEHDVPTRRFVVIGKDGSRTPARYCADCEVVAAVDGAEGGAVVAA